MAPGATAGSRSTTSAIRAKPKLLSHINWSPPFPGGTHTPLPLPGRNLAVVADEANAEKCAKGTFHTFVVDVRAPENPVPIATLPTPTRPRLLRASARSVRTTCTRTGPARFSSEETIFATYNNAGVRVFDIRDAFAPKEIAYWVPPAPKQADRSAAERRARREDRRHLRHARWADVCQRLERRAERAAVRGIGARPGEVATGSPFSARDNATRRRRRDSLLKSMPEGDRASSSLPIPRNGRGCRLPRSPQAHGG